MSPVKRSTPNRKPAAKTGEPPFRKILIANRGEIALRVIFACKELGIQTVAVYSEADRNALHVRFADEDICIGPPASGKSYLNIPQVIAAAEVTGAEAIHPGYGFLSENPHFVDVCQACGIVFIGPNAEIIRTMGNKAQAKATMLAAGVPLMPGSDGIVETVEDALAWGEKIGYPVIVKASAGGGGRGMRIVNSPDEMSDMYNTARTEAKAAFTDDSVYMEKYLLEPRHIEVQILGDLFGNIIHLGERECSIQRRHQKLIEESPSPALTPELRKRIHETAVRAAKAVGYFNAGTIEFLLDARGDFFFMEMNTRVQVEHPVTELVSGVDIVKEQIRIAAGRKLSYAQEDIVLRGSAIECRINAEDPWKFTPCPGRITALHFPGGPGIRMDTAMHQDAVIPPYYDSMVAKLIAYGNDRTEALARMRRALDTIVVEGIRTTSPLHRRIIDHPDFIKGDFSTKWLEVFLAQLEKERAEEA
ncbi:acetyl-CoA carboxylase biotin carboxylase subunit [Mesoterricola silvestris]|uniref:Biotin carboxylase n=1 Tax=Mesoterricola silvestris TaxID=2927979 RepID=A0AA48H4B8_9BACT|nr:acetyl-CoA carboxylase biotin carboxylase subunit [Mesoterricola silvestris]BDU71628.1 acetyl-CoA carboxylase biotin carboxylase subunit [Mesoterricola silvestris]